jgi:predicted transcriptional regulator
MSGGVEIGVALCASVDAELDDGVTDAVDELAESELVTKVVVLEVLFCASVDAELDDGVTDAVDELADSELVTKVVVLGVLLFVSFNAELDDGVTDAVDELCDSELVTKVVVLGVLLDDWPGVVRGEVLIALMVVLPVGVIENTPLLVVRVEVAMLPDLLLLLEVSILVAVGPV